MSVTQGFLSGGFPNRKKKTNHELAAGMMGMWIPIANVHKFQVDNEILGKECFEISLTPRNILNEYTEFFAYYSFVFNFDSDKQ